MVQLPDYRAQRTLTPSATPTVQVSNAEADAMQRFGASLTELGGALQARQEKKDAFKADNAYRRLTVELENDLNNQAQTIQPGGEGFMTGFLTETFKPKRDAFLASLPDSLKPKFAEVLADETGADFAQWQTRAATVERDEGYRWTKQELQLTTQQMATAIAVNPEGYDDYFKSGRDLIASGLLPTPEKDLLQQQWEEMAQVAYLNTLLKDDPQGVLRELGVDARNLSPTTQFEVLSRAVQWQESTDNPNAISPKGAVGLMQVMPETAADIARDLGDENFPAGDSREAIRQYLSNPVVNKRYGEEYLRQQLRTFGNTRNPVETALVAYNAGPSVAQAWVESGYDDRMLPKETRDYKASILSSISAPTAKGDPSAVRFVSGDGKAPADLDGVHQDLQARVADAFATLGIEQVRVNSGHRTHAENKAAGGAENSQHLAGGALDINVANMPLAQRIELIKSLSAAGVTGIGIGANIIHADIGGRRAWGYATSAGGGEVPKWATGVIAEHLKGTTPRPVAINTRFGSLPYDQRERFIANADQAITAQHTAAARATAVQKVEIRNAMANEIASIRTSGTSTGQLDETAIATILGEDDYLKYIETRDVARRTFTAVDGMSTLAPEDLARRIEDYEPIPGAADFASQLEIQTAVQREGERVIRLRATSPGLAAMEFSDVKQAYDALQTPGKEPAPNEVQGFVRLMLEKQADFDVPPEARAPIPEDWAIEIGRALTRVPEPAGRNMEDIRYAIQAQYDGLKQYFGDYADEVMIYSLSEYKGMSKPTAELITGYMTAIQKGGDPFRTRNNASQAEDMDQVDSTGFGGWWNQQSQNAQQYARSLSPGSAAAIPEGSEGLTPEQMLRQQPVEE